ncbi:hypothetical protein [Bradyrhizobium diazoefficiens]|uniref:hypothetical protein n=1 Tax=Bradyrhizobium diazoefficiens TaxID=1355477 RepID=UPI0035194467
MLVGSSVAWRLKEEYFSLPRFRNLALAGGSPVTVLEILAKQPSLPKIILIETNVLSREPDSELIGQFSGSARAEAPFLRPVRTAVAAYERWNHAPPNPAQARAEQDRLLKEPPSTFDNKAYLDLALRQMNEGEATGPVRVNVARTRELIDDVQRRGSRAFLIEIPFEGRDRGLPPRRHEQGDCPRSFSGSVAVATDQSAAGPIALGRWCTSRRAIGSDRRARHRKRARRTRRPTPGQVTATPPPSSRRRR